MVSAYAGIQDIKKLGNLSDEYTQTQAMGRMESKKCNREMDNRMGI